eukprot:CAMPEP_0176456998 /NCGR_PEP_ID=MMETSP0127-20121128/31645_1 /TAXON_ID=938130 /ORGANISM="Platyophrya macrostoma, Strain WH" /LENGTH=237 /DNA_ID=CAMNT_0017847111 /DNA_START=51 /DNA_END=764 /DNA_ORIENTATION=-
MIALAAVQAADEPQTPLLDARMENQIDLLLQNLTTSGRYYQKGFKQLLTIFSDLYSMDKCFEDLTNIFKGTLISRLRHQDPDDQFGCFYDKFLAHMQEMLFLDVKVQSIFAANQDCVAVYNVAQYIAVELSKSLNNNSNATFERKDQFLSTAFNNRFLRSVVGAIESINSLWACTIENIKFAVFLRKLKGEGFFQGTDIMALNSIALQIGYNMEHCAMLAKIISPIEETKPVLKLFD